MAILGTQFQDSSAGFSKNWDSVPVSDRSIKLNPLQFTQNLMFRMLPGKNTESDQCFKEL